MWQSKEKSQIVEFFFPLNRLPMSLERAYGKKKSELLL